jgi:hypothetical protein
LSCTVTTSVVPVKLGNERLLVGPVPLDWIATVTSPVGGVCAGANKSTELMK